MKRNQNQGHNWKGGKMVRHYLDEVCSLWPYEEKKKSGKYNYSFNDYEITIVWCFALFITDFMAAYV